MRKTLIAMTAVSVLVGLSTAVYAAGINRSFNGNRIIGSSLLNVGGQENGRQSVSGVLNEQSVTGNGAEGIYNNATPIITF